MFLDRRLTRRPDDGEQSDAQYASEHCWLLEFVFKNSDLAEKNPVSEILDALIASGLPAGAREEVHTIIHELYMNALDHGILGLVNDSRYDEDAFYLYQQKREQRLQLLSQRQAEIRSWIKVDCTLDISDRPRLELIVADSGCGFSEAELTADQGKQRQQPYSGRGLTIVKGLVSDIQFYGTRNQVRISYQC